MRTFIKNNIHNILPKRMATSLIKTLRRVVSPLDLVQKDGKQRSAMTISCRDTDYIPKVNGAGKVFENNQGVLLQKMHNGILVESGGYYGEWMEEIIKKLRGHHEPQEEKVFHEVMKRIDSRGTMVELGAHWGYYSNWFNTQIANATNYCFEPDPGYLKGGIRNSQYNNTNLKYIQAAAGNTGAGLLRFAPETMPGKFIDVPVVSVDEAIKKYKLKKIDVLHMDVQGAELDALAGSEQAIKNKKLRFVFVSTHHHSISNDPQTHAKVLAFLNNHGAHIICSHSVYESFSGDGLVVASFSDRDKNFTVEVSHNTSDNSLFVDTEQDSAKLTRAYVKLYVRFKQIKNQFKRNTCNTA